MTTVTEAETTERPKAPVGPRIFRFSITLVVVVVAGWGALGLNVDAGRLLAAPAEVWSVVVRLAQPDLSPEAIQRALPKVMESFYIAWIGTIIGALFSFPLAFLAAKNVSRSVVNNVVRQILNAIRAVPEVLVAMVLIPVTGLGAWTGTLALGIHSIGTLGKLSSEVIEGIDPGPVEAVAAVGGGRFTQMRFGVVPQVMPNILAYWLYRFEINIRASAVLGIIGAGGIGAELIAQFRFRDFARAGTVLFLTVITVIVVDMISARVRRRIISGHKEPGPMAFFLAARTPTRIATLLGVAAAIALAVFIAIQLQVDVGII